VSGSGISWAICKSAPCSRQITTPAPHYSVFYRPGAIPAAQPTASKHWRPPPWYQYTRNCSECKVDFGLLLFFKDCCCWYVLTVIQTSICSSHEQVLFCEAQLPSVAGWNALVLVLPWVSDSPLSRLGPTGLVGFCLGLEHNTDGFKYHYDLNPFYFLSHTLAFHSQLLHVLPLPRINLCNAPL